MALFALATLDDTPKLVLFLYFSSSLAPKRSILALALNFVIKTPNFNYPAPLLIYALIVNYLFN